MIQICSDTSTCLSYIERERFIRVWMASTFLCLSFTKIVVLGHKCAITQWRHANVLPHVQKIIIFHLTMLFSIHSCASSRFSVCLVIELVLFLQYIHFMLHILALFASTSCLFCFPWILIMCRHHEGRLFWVFVEESVCSITVEWCKARLNDVRLTVRN
jgi:hypothetical protein